MSVYKQINLRSLLRDINSRLPDNKLLAIEQRDLRSINAISKGVKDGLGGSLGGASRILEVINHTIEVSRELEISENAIQKWIELESVHLSMYLN